MLGHFLVENPKGLPRGDHIPRSSHDVCQLHGMCETLKADIGRIFEKSVMLMENLMAANLAKETEPFQWHINGHSAFQAIMHVLSELKSPQFRASSHDGLLDKAISALRMMRKLKEAEASKTWRVVRRMIDRTIPPDCNSAEASPFATSVGAEKNRAVDSGSVSKGSSSEISGQGVASSFLEQLSMETSYDASLGSNPARWENDGGDATLADAPDFSELSGEFDWVSTQCVFLKRSSADALKGWWNLDSLPWSPPA